MPPAQPRKISACINCRQMKLRCDARARFPAPCTRCAKYSQRCSIDPSFKRTAKREQISALEKELQEMRASMQMSPGINDNSGHVLTPDSGSGYEAMQNAPSPSIDLVLEDAENIFATQTIDDVEVTPTDIFELLQGYYSNYDPHLPILPEIGIFAKNYYSCPLLFWTIIAVSSKDSQKHLHLYLSLSKIVPRLATDISAAIGRGRSLATVQALLILCWWPFPFSATLTDPSWMYCGLATHIGLQFGLHRPQTYSDFFYDTNLDAERLVSHQKTWIAVFITNQYQSSHLGIPATIQVDSLIFSALATRPAWLPPVLDQHLKIAHQNFQVSHTLGNADNSITGLQTHPVSMMQMFDAKYRALDAQISSQWTPFTEIAFLKARLQLYSFALSDIIIYHKSATHSHLSTAPANPPYYLRPGVSELLANASLIALRLIQIATSLSIDVPIWTSIVRSSISYAVFFLLKLSSAPEHALIDVPTAKNSVAAAWNLLHNCSDMHNDQLSRTCAIIEYLSKSEADAPTQTSNHNPATSTSTSKNGHPTTSSSSTNPSTTTTLSTSTSTTHPHKRHDLSLVVKSRMAGNLVYDAAWRAKDRFSKDIRDLKPLDYTYAAEMESLLQFGLDFAGLSPLPGEAELNEEFAAGWNFDGRLG